MPALSFRAGQAGDDRSPCSAEMESRGSSALHSSEVASAPPPRLCQTSLNLTSTGTVPESRFRSEASASLQRAAVSDMDTVPIAIVRAVTHDMSPLPAGINQGQANQP